MSTDDQTQNGNDNGTEELEGVQKPDELGMLKQRARMMGIPFSNNISVETLKAKIQERMDGKSDETPKVDDLGDDNPPAVQTAQQNPPTLQDPEAPAPAPKETLRQKVKREGMKLVRCRIMNLDPKKKDLPGEIFTVANEYLGTVRKFIPFGEVTENGYHVPQCIFDMMKGRKFLNIRTYKDRRNNNQIRVEQNWAPEFSLEVLPPLTKEELSKLATAQAAAGGLGS